MKLNKNIEKILEQNDFNIVGELEKGYNTEQYYLEFGKETPCGEDWTEVIWFDGSPEGFANELMDFAYNYDIDDAVEIWIPCRGKGGCPSSISDLIEDAKWKKKELENLANEFLSVNETEKENIDPYYNKSKMIETLERLAANANNEDAEIVKQIKDCLEWPLKLFSFQEAEFQTGQILEDIQDYEESDIRDSVIRLANELYLDCEPFNNGEESYEMAKEFWNEEIKLYISKEEE